MIVLKDVNKKFESKQVLKDISFHISPGERVGIIGKNGAGKTTLLQVIAGLIRPDSGFIRVENAENTLKDYTVLRNMACVSGTKSQLWNDLRVKDSLEHCIRMYGIPREKAKQKFEQLMSVFDIRAFLNEEPGRLSQGERMRCELVYALLADPKLLLLDEAMIGLDVSAKYKIMQYLLSYCKEKKSTLLYTSHNLTEVEKLCERIIVLDQGQIIFDGSIERIMLQYAPLYRMEADVEGILPDLEDLPLENVFIENDRMCFVYDHRKIDTAQILKHLMGKSRIKDVRLSEPDLEETIRKIYGRQD